jgi:hypothetical protein
MMHQALKHSWKITLLRWGLLVALVLFLGLTCSGCSHQQKGWTINGHQVQGRPMTQREVQVMDSLLTHWSAGQPEVTTYPRSCSRIR